MNYKKRKLGMLSKIMTFILATVLLFNGNGRVAQAYSVTTSGNAAFNTTNQTFKNANNPKYTNQTQVITGSISKAYKQDVYHYQCQRSGYYAVYTRSRTDTVGALYKEDGLFNPAYKYIVKNDDYFSAKDQNFYFVSELNLWNNYYVCVRCFGQKTGNYTLYIEPNEDKIFHMNYGVWESTKISSSDIIAGMWIKKKVYLNKEQAVLYYWLLDPATKIQGASKVYGLSELQQLYYSDSSTALNIVTTTLSAALGVKNTAIGIAASILGLIIGESVSASKSKQTAESMKKTLVKLCGVHQTANAKTFQGSWSAKNGLLATKWFDKESVLRSYFWEYSTHVIGSQLKGVQWNVGKWTF